MVPINFTKACVYRQYIYVPVGLLDGLSLLQALRLLRNKIWLCQLEFLQKLEL